MAAKKKKARDVAPLACGIIPMDAEKDPPIPVLRIKKGDSLKTIYAKARKAFTADDLQIFTEFDVGIPAKDVLAEMEAIDRSEAAKQRKTRHAHGR